MPLTCRWFWRISMATQNFPTNKTSLLQTVTSVTDKNNNQRIDGG
ncbi:hypothetical protein MIZ03_0836 [Rhodoferax lithotrophicus]|uniref:Uncharacterized protein n=1 Tax=Rhodoferax lithotrophicus TaxID=2798804 RepID=A0ABM7MI71_9BURK|nr:hypothetical protein MIZ03_0836 [Rhodoferax sp. MIZ03]